VIYKVPTPHGDYWLCGSPEIPIARAFNAFKAKLSEDPAEREQQLLAVVECYSTGEEPVVEGLLYQAFFICLSARQKPTWYARRLSTWT